MTKNYSSKEIQKELKQLYTYFPETKRLLRTFGCDGETAKDVFQEALLIFFQKREDSNFVLENQPIHYIKQTCKFLWYNQSRKEHKQNNTIFPNPIELEELSWVEEEQKYAALEKSLESLGKQCKELLQLFYAFGKSMMEIAQVQKFKNEKVAKAQKYRCLQKAKELVASELVNQSTLKA